jgi:DNA-binding NarL/FixJ family response regulator
MDRRGLIALLEQQRDFEIVADAATSRETVDLCKRFTPDVAILSIQLPDLDGVSAISAIRHTSPSTAVIALAERDSAHCLVLNPPGSVRYGFKISNPTPSTCTDCLELAVSAGALGTLRRDAEPDELYSAIRAVAHGNAWYERRTASALMKKAESRSQTPPLSARELEVAGLISDGLSNKEIGRELRISEPTVKKHVGHILAKLDLQDRLQVGVFVIRNPLLIHRKHPS